MKFSIERQIPLAFAIAILLLVVLGFLAYQNLTALNRAVSWEVHTQQVLQRLDETLVKLVDAETAARGFVITGDDNILDGYDPTGQDIQNNLTELKTLTKDSQPQLDRLGNIESLARDKIAVLNRQINLRRAASREEASKIVGNGEGRALMSRIRALLDEMKGQETSLLREREGNQQKNFTLAVYFSIIGSGVGIFILLLANLVITRQIKLRGQAEEALRLSNKDLEIRVEKRTGELAETNKKLQTQIEKREEAEKRQKFAIEAGQLGIWSLNSKTELYEADARTLELSGVAEEDFDGTGKALFRNLHTEDLPKVRAALNDALTNSTDYFAEFRIISADNSTHWLQAVASPQQNEDGSTHLTGFSSDITARKEYELALEKSERHLRSVINSLGTFVGVLKPDGTLIEVNQAALEVSSLRPEEVLNLHFADTFWWNFSEESKTRLRKAIELAADGKSSRYDTEVRIGENQFITLDFMLAPLFDENGNVTHLIPSGLDLTPRKQAEDALRQSELFNRTTIDSLSSNIAVVDKQGLILTVNNAWNVFAAQNRSNSNDELIYLGVNYLDGCRNGTEEEDYKTIAENLQKVLSGELKSFSLEYPSDSPSEKRWFLLNITALLTPEGGAVISQTNITDRVVAEFERERLYELEKRARLDAEAANRVRDEFLATVSHELRNPLNAILGWSKMLQKNQLDPGSHQKAIDAVVRNAEAQNHLIEDLLDVSRIIAGKLRLDIAPLNPADFVEAAVETVRPAAEAKEITLNVQIESNADKINGDGNRLQQVVWNLLSNAIKFTPKKGHVGITVACVDSMIEIDVTDDGIGIESAFLPNVFERFRQADASTIRKFGGLGLGLAIVRHIVEMHGGTVSVKSGGENHGSTFIVKLPISAAVKDNSPATVSASGFTNKEPEHTFNLSGISVLAVDDEPDTRQLLSQVLTYHGAAVRTASSAEEALAEFQKETFDVIISDIGMPEEDGYSLIRKIRALPGTAGPKTPAIAMTAFARPADRMKALESGFQIHISKPVEPDELATVIASVTGRIVNS